MKKQIWIATLLYTLSILSTLGFLYTLINSNIELIVVIISITFLSLGFGYTLSSYILSQKFEIDENLLHLTKEILHEINIPISTIQANSKLLKRSLKDDKKALEIRIEYIKKWLKSYAPEKYIFSIKEFLFAITLALECKIVSFSSRPFSLSVFPVSTISTITSLSPTRGASSIEPLSFIILAGIPFLLKYFLAIV